MIEFRTYLRQLRIAQGMTQLDLAEQLGVSQTLINNWERGRTLPGLAELNAVMRVLGGDVQRALNLIEGVEASAALLPEQPTAEAIAAVVLDSVAADHQRAEQLLYKALRRVISAAPRPRGRWGRSQRRG